MSNFEERLLTELRGVVAERRQEGGRGARRTAWRRPRLVLAGSLAAAVAIAAIAGVFLSAGTQRAYAVTKNDDGTITVTIDSLTDAAGLQSALQADGVNAVVEYLPEGKMCKQPWFNPAGAAAAGGTETSSVGRNGNRSTTFSISGNRPAGDTLVISTQTGPNGEQALGMGWAQGTVPPCQVVDAPAGSGPFGSKPVSNSAPAP